jgi:hypothetical protein
LTAQSIKAGLAYFALVFGAGFVLGVLRVSFLVPRFGERIAELGEMPLMLAVIVIAARFIMRRFAVPFSMAARIGTGPKGPGSDNHLPLPACWLVALWPLY